MGQRRRLRNVAERPWLHDWDRAAARYAVLQRRLGGAKPAASVETAVAGRSGGEGRREARRKERRDGEEGER